MTQPRAVIFDMDGVIVDSEPRHERAFIQVARELGYGTNPGIRFADYVGQAVRDLWTDFAARNHLPQTVEELSALKRRRMVEIIRREQPLFKGVPELVQNLAGRFRLG